MDVSFVVYAIIGAVFWFLNTVVKKVLGILTLPVKFVTLGLSSFAINVALFYFFQAFINAQEFGVVISLGSIGQIIVLSLLISLVDFIFKKIV